MSKLRKALHAVGLVLTVLVGGELGARVDDWLQLEVPLFASPDRERDLVQPETWGAHGRPYGHFRKWKLNAEGFRAPALNPKPTPCRPRVLVLGASETFGLYEDAGQEYPAQLAERLGPRAEVINVSMAGLTLKSMSPYWDNWLARLEAKQVVVYPCPLFYLEDDILKPWQPRTDGEPAPRLRPRLADRLSDVYRTLPDWVKNLREQWAVDKALREGPGMFQETPADRLQLFREDLRQLVQKIQASGAEPVLLTYASSNAWPMRPEDAAYVNRMRMFYPRATAEILVDFEYRANQVIRELAEETNVRLIDADAKLSGQIAWFADMVHFNSQGAAQMAALLGEQLQPKADR